MKIFLPLFWILHWVLAFLLVSVALPVVVVYWLIWLLAISLRPFRRPTPTEFQMPQMDELASRVSLERLLGAKATGQIDAVFEGGGVKAIAQVGAARAAEELQLKWSLLGGTSGGAIVAALLAAGKDSQEIWRVLTGIGLHRLVHVWYLPAVPLLQKRIYFYLPLLPNLFFTKGLVSGRQFLNIMKGLLAQGEDELRFKDVLNPGKDNEAGAPRYRLKMVATDISRGTPIVLPDDLPIYWKPWERARQLSRRNSAELTPEDAQDWWSLSEAVRMSMSIPFFFEPFALHLNMSPDNARVQTDKMGRKGKKVLIVDGGVSSNFPIWLFDRLDRTASWPTFGFLLDESKGTRDRSVPSIGILIEMAKSVINTGMGALDKRLSEHDQYRTSRLRTLGVNTTDFGLAQAKQAKLFEAGYTDATEFLVRFDWSYYVDRFRR